MLTQDQTEQAELAFSVYPEPPASVLELIDVNSWLAVHKRWAAYALKAAQIACDYRLACPITAGVGIGRLCS